MRKKLSFLKFFMLILSELLSFVGLIIGIFTHDLIYVIGFGLSFLVWAIYTIALIDLDYFR